MFERKLDFGNVSLVSVSQASSNGPPKPTALTERVTALEDEESEILIDSRNPGSNETLVHGEETRC
jgi:hypothetical protein